MTKLCECGCGEPAPIATLTRNARGQKRGQPIRFVHGHNRRTQTMSVETRAKISASKKGKGEGRDLPPMPGPKNPRWKGDDVGYDALHSWLRRNHPKTGVCEECGAEGKTEYAFKRHPEPHTRDREDYRELCSPCHVRLDAQQRRLPAAANAQDMEVSHAGSAIQVSHP